MNTNEHAKEKTVFTDDELLNIFTKNGTLKYVSIRHINKIKVQNPDAYNALVNRFDDSNSFKETIHRLKFGLYDKPCCPICGKKLLYVSSRPPYWQKFCSQECLHKSEEHWAKCKESAYKRNPNDPYNKEKSKQTCLKRYGVEWTNSVPEIKEKLYYKKEWAIENTTYTEVCADGEEKTHIGLAKLLELTSEQKEMLKNINDLLQKLYDSGVKLERDNANDWYAFNTNRVKSTRIVCGWMEVSEWEERADEETVQYPMSLKVDMKLNCDYCEDNFCIRVTR